MTAHSVNESPEDPARILRLLPHEWHEQFLGEYHQALEAAREVSRFQNLPDVLHLWHLRAVAYSKPAFNAALQAAHDNRAEEFTPAERVIPRWQDIQSI